MSRSVPTLLRQTVRADFEERCAYCQSPEALVVVTFEVEHIIPQSVGGETACENLCLACPMCNRHKAARVTAIDQHTDSKVSLFHPRRDTWNEHFEWDLSGFRIVGLTPTGRATAAALRMNREAMVSVREQWSRLGKHPP